VILFLESSIVQRRVREPYETHWLCNEGFESLMRPTDCATKGSRALWDPLIVQRRVREPYETHWLCNEGFENFTRPTDCATKGSRALWDPLIVQRRVREPYETHWFSLTYSSVNVLFSMLILWRKKKQKLKIVYIIITNFVALIIIYS